MVETLLRSELLYLEMLASWHWHKVNTTR